MPGVVLCHTSPDVRDRLAQAAAHVPSLAPVSTVAGADELVRLVGRSTPSIVLLDAHLAGGGLAESVRRVVTASPQTVVIILAGPGDEVALDRAITAGARGYIATDASTADLAAVAAHVLAAPTIPSSPRTPDTPAAGVPMPRTAAAASSSGAATGLSAKADPTGPGHGRAAAPGMAPTPVAPPAGAMPSAFPRKIVEGVELTRREYEVLVGMSNGRSNGQIGSDLFVSEDTVKTHAQRLFRKLGASDRAQAVAIGLRSGLIT